MFVAVQGVMNTLVQDMRLYSKKHQFKEFEIKEVFLRKDILVSKLVLPLRNYETYALEKGKMIHPLNQKETKRCLSQEAKKYYRERAEYYFKCSVENMVFTEWRFARTVLESYFISILEKSVTRGLPICCWKQQEEQLSYTVTKQLRPLFGKGPQKSRAVFLDDRVLIYEIKGLLSPVEYKYLCEVEDSRFPHYIQEALTEVVLFAHQEVLGNVPEVWIQGDYANNNIYIITKWKEDC